MEKEVQEIILKRLDEFEESFNLTVNRLLTLTERQSELHFAEKEKENKRKNKRVIIISIALVIGILGYSITYFNYSREMNKIYFSKIIEQESTISDIQERLDLIEKNN